MTDFNWHRLAACLEVDTSVMYPPEEQGDHQKRPVLELINAAKAVCNRCLVREVCLEDAMTRREKWGVWGGLTGRERELKRRNERQRLQYAEKRDEVRARKNADYWANVERERARLRARPAWQKGHPVKTQQTNNGEMTA